uniref:non-specific serine/threonine protein kinase n=1 Tax=Panagrolaimus davidi TaxID=227884 RepID=A0A914PTL3_9BILA
MGTETRLAGAQTVVGTPYYISPEMCEGRSYNSKSDIWALGCILYEMACLQKTFEGSNLPALVGKIVKGDYEQIRGPYSNDLKLLVREMLKVEPELRPTATKVLEMVQRSRGKKGERFRGIPRSQSPRNCHSALYEFDIAKVTLSAVSNTPKHIRVKQLAVGHEHILMLTIDNVVYAWGDNKFGQLGLGDRRPRLQPVRIEILDGKDITRIACGSTFSVFVADRGIVMVCGNRKFTGNGKTKEDYLKPKVIDSLLRDDIVDLSVGTEHAAAVCGDGQVFVWGNGQSGQLGTGKQEHVQTARKVEIPAHLVVINVKCGPDSTALITSCGTLILMGSNKYNKLNLNTRIGFFSHVKNTQSEVENILIPTCMKAFNSRVVDVSLGSFHSGVLLESG